MEVSRKDDGYEFTLVHRLQNVEEEIRRMSMDIAQTMERIQKALDGDLRLNELGELQSRGPRLDALLGQRQLLVDSILGYRYQRDER